jgi:S1-C subfamily serine protease
MLLAGAAGCGSDDDGASGTSTGSSKSSSARDTVARVRTSVVSINANDGDYHSHGTGVIVNAARNLVVTSGHVVDSARAMDVTIGEKLTVKGRVVARAQCENIALVGLFPEQEGLVELPFGNSDQVEAGDQVTALGFPGTAQTKDGKEKIAITEGRVSITGADVRLTPHLPELESLIAHQAPLNGQSTGGPLLDSEGNFIALNTVITGDAATEGTPGVYYAVPSNRIRQMIAELEPGEKSFYVGWGKYHHCHRGMGRLARAVEVADHSLPAGKTPKRSSAAATHEGH